MSDTDSDYNVCYTDASQNPNPEASMIMTRACELLILEMAVKSCVSAGQLGRSTIEVCIVV